MHVGKGEKGRASSGGLANSRLVMRGLLVDQRCFSQHLKRPPWLIESELFGFLAMGWFFF